MMNNAIAEFAGVILILITLPGTIELGLLTFAALLLKGRADAAKKIRVEGSNEPQDSHPAIEGHESRIKRLAVVIPARNEEVSITRCVRSLNRCERPPAPAEVTIVVVADNCDDNTAEVAASAGARVIERHDSTRRGKQFALDFTFKKLLEEGFDAFLVVDADTVVEANLVREVVESLDRGSDSTQARYLTLNEHSSVLPRLRGVAIMAVNVLRPLGRSRLGLSCGLTGNGFAVTRQTLEAVAYDVNSHNDDQEYHARLVLAGRKVVFIEQTTVRGDMPGAGAAARAQQARWEGSRTRLIVQYLPTLARAVAGGNLRALEPLLDLLLMPLAIQVLLLLCAAAIPFTAGRIYGVFALMLVALHVGVAIRLAGGSLNDFAALIALPGYLLWKLALLPASIRASRANAEWIRNKR